ncbi:MAG: hypothetical protein QOG89_2044 [Thermomicrobiales bacterium]|nr:hypothetical protein [Thermomicrobiales bacterium]
MAVDVQHPLEPIRADADDLSFTAGADAATDAVPNSASLGTMPPPPTGLRNRVRGWLSSPSCIEYDDLLGFGHQHHSCCG